MKLSSISIRPSGVLNSWVMEIACETPMGEMKTTQHFDDFGGFLTAVKEAGTFFAVRLGKIKSVEANDRLLSRPLAPNPNGSIQ